MAFDHAKGIAEEGEIENQSGDVEAKAGAEAEVGVAAASTLRENVRPAAPTGRRMSRSAVEMTSWMALR